MTGKYLLSAASVALFIAASSAQAADVTPILAAGVPPVAAVETDPTVARIPCSCGVAACRRFLN